MFAYRWIMGILAGILFFIPSGFVAAQEVRRVAISPLLWEKGDSVGPTLSQAAVETLSGAFASSGTWQVEILDKPVSSDRLTALARSEKYDYILFGRITSRRGYHLQLSLYDFSERTVTANRSSSVRRSVEIFGLCDRMALSLVSDMTGSGAPDERIDFSPLFGGGNGTAEKPFLIRNPDHLVNMDLAPHASFRLVADLDLTGIAWVPLSPFFGRLDGGGHTLSGLTLSGDPFRSGGLFSGILPGGEVTDLVFKEVKIRGADSAGALAGYNHGNVSAITVQGEVSGEYSTGGIVGHNEGEIVRCRFEGRVSGHLHSIGGIAGRNHGEITLCRFKGEIANDGTRSRPESDYIPGSLAGTQFDVGGIAGWNLGDISRCRAEGNLFTEKNPAGGIAGRNGGVVSDCLFTGRVEAKGSDAGGITGYNVPAGIVRRCLVIQSVIVSNGAAGGLSGGTERATVEDSSLAGVRIVSPAVSLYSPAHDGALIRHNRNIDGNGEKPWMDKPFDGWDFDSVWEIHPKGPDLRQLP